jgi:AMMECR1 domain-containing protein
LRHFFAGRFFLAEMGKFFVDLSFYQVSKSLPNKFQKQPQKPSFNRVDQKLTKLFTTWRSLKDFV